MLTRLLKVISGGQTGVDRGALDAAIELGVECGGWCPTGRLAEDGLIPERYPVVELGNGGYAERTAQNVADSDATLIISNGKPIGGTRETMERCVEVKKPYLLLDHLLVTIDDGVELAFEFIPSLDFARDDDCTKRGRATSQSMARRIRTYLPNYVGDSASDQWTERR